MIGTRSHYPPGTRICFATLSFAEQVPNLFPGITRHFGRKWAGSLLPSALLDVQHAEPEEDAHNG